MFYAIELIVLYLHCYIIYRSTQYYLQDTHISSAKIESTEGIDDSINGATYDLGESSLIAEYNYQAYLVEELEYAMCLVIFLMFIRALELLQFSMELNLSVATFKASVIDILYWLVVTSFVFIGYAVTGHVVYFTLEEFSTIQSTMMVLLKMIIGTFDEIQTMNELSPTFTPIYFTSFMIINIIFLTNIFIGLVL